MAHEQFFYTTQIDNDILLLSGQEHQHISRVMRKKKGDHVWVSNGKGITFHTQILDIDKESTRCRILKSYPRLGEPANNVSLAVGMIKPAHWEILLEKAVELGVHDIYPLSSRYTVIPNIKRERNEKILLSALKQCGRSYLPVLREPMSFKDFIIQKRNEVLLICDNQDDYPMLEAASDTRDYIVLIGPEGGFTKEEVHLAIEHHAKPVLLSNRRLRTETACLSALARLVV